MKVNAPVYCKIKIESFKKGEIYNLYSIISKSYFITIKGENTCSMYDNTKFHRHFEKVSERRKRIIEEL